jgi:hypothetical protein
MTAETYSGHDEVEVTIAPFGEALDVTPQNGDLVAYETDVDGIPSNVVIAVARGTGSVVDGIETALSIHHYMLCDYQLRPIAPAAELERPEWTHAECEFSS